MASYNFHQTDRDEETGNANYVSREFDTDYLDRIVEEFFWFLQSSGFNYVQNVKVGYSDGEGATEFGAGV